MTQVNSSRDYVKALILMLGALTFYGASYAKAAEDMLIPITISTDGARHLSSLFLHCKMEDFGGVPLDNFRDSKELIHMELKSLFADIARADKDAYFRKGEAWQEGRPVSETRKRELAERNVSGFRRLIEIYDERCQGLKIYKDIKLGNGGLIIWGTDKDDKRANTFRQRRAFRYGRTDTGGISWNTLIEAPGKLEGLITESLEQIADDPSGYIALIGKRAEFDYRIEIPGTQGEAPIYMLFNGQTYNHVDIIKSEVPVNDGVLLFLKEAYGVWIHDGADAFANYYTRASKERILNGLRVNRALFESHKNAIAVGKQILFILNADPYYIVFFQQGKHRYIGCEYVVYDSTTGTYKLTNIGMGDLTSQYFRSDEGYAILNKVDSDLFARRSN